MSIGRQSAIVLYATVAGGVVAFVGMAPAAPPWLAAIIVATALAAAGALLAASRHSPANRAGANHHAEMSSLRQELEYSRHHYQQLFDIVPCYITIHNRNLNILESNRLFREDFGELQPNDTCYRAYKGLEEACPDCPVNKTFADGKVHSSEEKVVTRDGREAAMIVYSMPIRGEEGEITAVMEVATNITQVKALQRQLAMTGLAVTGMAHRIKNVLMGLEGGIFVVNTGFENNDSETLKKGWDMVQRNVGRIGAIAHDLLFCSKEREPKLKPGVAPAAVARDAVALFATRAEREGIALRLETSNDSRGVYDPEALHKLFTNLIANAIDACRFDPDAEKKRHEIVVRCAEDTSGATVVQVRDNGAGIAKEDSPKVFKGFFSSKGTEGTGLGLFVVQTVVEQHEGEITFQSHEGDGTAFTAVLRSQEPRLAVPDSSEVNPRAPPPPQP